MALTEYKRKRNFRKTAEPAGSPHRGAKGAPQNARNTKNHEDLSYVIQKHDASRLHYDFRLEWKGVLLSWAVPKGPSLDPGQKRLAVHVEDHPLEYGSFEGTIPKGQYGGGTVMLWDRGKWIPEGNPTTDLKKGTLKFRLDGQRLKGRWMLVRLKPRGDEPPDKNWILIKERDDEARPGSNDRLLTERASSVTTGRSMDEIAGGTQEWNGRSGKRTTRKKRAIHLAVDVARAVRKSMPSRIKPQLATLVEKPPSGENWLHEIKFDGYRLLAFAKGKSARLFTRSGQDWSERFPEILKAVRALNLPGAILDGEVVAMDDKGISRFQILQNALRSNQNANLIYYVFDLPWCDGFDLTHAPLLARKTQLARLLEETSDPAIRLSDHISGEGAEVLRNACRLSLEGIVSKDAQSAYVQRRTRTWLKSKCLQEQEFVIGGFTAPHGSRKGFGALLLGYFDGAEFVFSGKVGTGFDDKFLRELHAKLVRIKRDSASFTKHKELLPSRNVTWVQPRLVGEVAFTEWTHDSQLRHPVFLGLREDKPARQIGREKPVLLTRAEKKSPKATASFAGVTLTHSDRILYPEQGIAKHDLAEHYLRWGERMLPYVADRPLMLLRCPQGRSGECFFQKHASEAMGEAIRHVKLSEKGGPRIYVTIDDIKGLISLVQIGTLEIHGWACKADRAESPDSMIFDLDPDDSVPWARVVEAARMIRVMLRKVDLESFVKTSGGKGLHVFLPLQARADWQQTSAFAQSVADQCLRLGGEDQFTLTMSKAKRKGRIFVDHFRNRRGSTCVLPYSTRAREGCPVSLPIPWNQLGRLKSAKEFHIGNLPSPKVSDPWTDYWKIRQSITPKRLKEIQKLKID